MKRVRPISEVRKHVAVVEALRRAYRYVSAGVTAKAVLSLTPFQQDIMCAELRAFLLHDRTTGLLSKTEPPVVLWERTPFAKLHHQHKLSALTRFASRILSRNQAGRIVLVDVGPGDGRLLIRYLTILRNRARGRDFHVVLIEPSKDFLSRAVERCKAAGLSAHQITPIGKAVEKLSPRTVSEIGALTPLLTVASESLHHLPDVEKVEVLRILGSLSGFVLLNELEGDHDLPEAGSKRLIASAWQFYSFLLEQVRKARLSQTERRVCIEQFIFAEAADVLLKPRMLRGNFHSTEKQWVECFHASSLTRVSSQRRQLMARAPRALSFLLARV